MNEVARLPFQPALLGSRHAFLSDPKLTISIPLAVFAAEAVKYVLGVPEMTTRVATHSYDIHIHPSEVLVHEAGK